MMAMMVVVRRMIMMGLVHVLVLVLMLMWMLLMPSMPMPMPMPTPIPMMPRIPGVVTQEYNKGGTRQSCP